MGSDLIWQYIIVCIIILGVILKIILGIRKNNRNKSEGSCYGCSLANSCSNFNKPKKDSAGIAIPTETNHLKRDCNLPGKNHSDNSRKA